MKVYISRGLDRNSLEILFTEERGPTKQDFYVAKPIKLEWIKVGAYEITKEATISLGRFEGEEFLKAMAEELDQYGVKTDNDYKIRGLLEAKQDHLNDMKRLVFKEEE